MAFWEALASTILISAVSFIGGLSLALSKNALRSTITLLVSFAAGSLLGDALLHLLPESAQAGLTLPVAFAILGGILVSFFIERFVHWHHCHTPGEHVHATGYVNLFGDAVHNFIDGVIVGASYLVSVPVGVATTLAIVLHELPQELGDFAVLLHSGFSVRKALLFNFITACTAILGTALVFVIRDLGSVQVLLAPFAAGAFIYVSLADLVPELHKETRAGHGVAQLALFLGGIGLMSLLLLVG